MIGLLRGTVWTNDGDKIILDVYGVGYLLHVPGSIASILKAEEERVFYTHLIVREDDMSLYGFLNRDDKDLFIQLLSVSGIGPKAALAFLTMLTGQQIKQAIVREDSSLLTEVPGIGNKTAKRLILELKEKVKDVDNNGEEELGSSLTMPSTLHETLESLLALGFSRNEASEALAKMDKKLNLTTEQQIRETLRILAKPLEKR